MDKNFFDGVNHDDFPVDRNGDYDGHIGIYNGVFHGDMPRDDFEPGDRIREDFDPGDILRDDFEPVDRIRDDFDPGDRIRDDQIHVHC